MLSVTHEVSWYYVQSSPYTGPVTGLGPFVTGVSVQFWLCESAHSIQLVSITKPIGRCCTRTGR
jgi:hypothetical protein